MLLAVLLSCAASLGAPAEAGISSWTPAVRERMLSDAVKVAPPALAHIILKHPEALRAGIAEPALSEGDAQHRQEADQTACGAAASLAEAVRRAVAAFDGHRPMAEAVRQLGVAAHFAADLNDPLLAAPGAATAPFARDFSLYVERNVHRFAVVFYGYPSLHPAAGPPADGAIKEAGIGSARMARGYYAHIDRAYSAAGGEPLLDVRSIPFGVAAICYSRAVTDVARAWLHAWRAARGDLEGTPYLPGISEAGALAPDRPAPAAAAASAGPPDAGAPPITKTIIGKRGKRTPGNPAPDPNAVTPADPNQTE